VEVRTLAIVSPSPGAIIPVGTGDGAEFFVTGTVSPNAHKIRVVAYSTGSWAGMAGEMSERTTDGYYLTQFALGDETWSYKVMGGPDGNLVGVRARFEVTAYYTDGTTKTEITNVAYQYDITNQDGAIG